MGRIGIPRMGVRKFTNAKRMTRIILLIENTSNGISIPNFKEEYGSIIAPMYIDRAIEFLETNKYIRIEGNRIRYTETGTLKRLEIVKYLSENPELIVEFEIEETVVQPKKPVGE